MKTLLVEKGAVVGKSEKILTRKLKRAFLAVQDAMWMKNMASKVRAHPMTASFDQWSDDLKIAAKFSEIISKAKAPEENF